MLTDSHIHIGQFYDTYTSPENLVRYLDAVGVERFAVSSTTICEGDYVKVVNELTDLVSIAGSRAFPTLWVLPSMFEDGGIERFLNSAIVWRFLKIHPQLHPNTWTESATCTASLLSLARKLRIPVLIHTGEREGCQPELLREMVAGNSDITFIFAHGRPLQQTAEIMQECPNVWCDTAFMPIKNIASLCGLGLSERILWGTDYPIISHFRPDCDAVAYYSGLLEELKASVSGPDFQKITADNFTTITTH